MDPTRAMTGSAVPLRRLLTAVFACAFVVAGACSSTQLPDIDQAATSQPTTTPPPSTVPPTGTEGATEGSPPIEPIDLPGRMAALGPAGELLVRADDGSWNQWSSDGSVVSQFNWSPDGAQLAWTEVTRTGTTLVVGDGTDRTTLTTDRPPFFLWWTRDGNQVSHLGTSDQGVSLALSGIGGERRDVSEAQPLFYSWSAQGRLVLHGDATELTLVEGGDEELIAQASGNFQTPAWLDEERVVALVELEGGDALSIVNVADRIVTPLFEVEGRISFAASPDGTRLAYQILDDDTADNRPVGRPLAQPDDGEEPDSGGPPDVLVLDLETEQLTLAFVGQALWLDWAPDSSSLAALIAADDLTWRIWNDRELVRSRPVQISPVMAENFVPFYDQYTQTMTGWSPDSTTYAFAADIDGQTGVFAQEAAVGSEAGFLGPGVVVAWAPSPG